MNMRKLAFNRKENEMENMKHANDNDWEISYVSRKNLQHEINEMKSAVRDLKKRRLNLFVDSLFYDSNANLLTYELRFPVPEDDFYTLDYIDYVLEHHITQFVNSWGNVAHKKKFV